MSVLNVMQVDILLFDAKYNFEKFWFLFKNFFPVAKTFKFEIFSESSALIDIYSNVQLRKHKNLFVSWQRKCWFGTEFFSLHCLGFMNGGTSPQNKPKLVLPLQWLRLPSLPRFLFLTMQSLSKALKVVEIIWKLKRRTF